MSQLDLNELPPTDAADATLVVSRVNSYQPHDQSLPTVTGGRTRNPEAKAIVSSASAVKPSSQRKLQVHAPGLPRSQMRVVISQRPVTAHPPRRTQAANAMVSNAMMQTDFESSPSLPASPCKAE